MRKSQKHRPSPDQKDWERFCVATTGRIDLCAICKCTCKPERGHIVPRGKIDLELFDDWDNREPICISCNRRYGKKTAPDGRLPGWNERFFIAQAKKMRPQIRLRVIPEKSGYLRVIETPSQADENTFVIDWNESSILSPISELSESTRSQLPNQLEAAAIVNKFLTASLNAPEGYTYDSQCEWRYVAPRAPNEDQYGKMVKIAMSNPREVFLGAGREYLMSGIGIEVHGGDRTGYLKAAWNSWEDFINGFQTTYVVKWRQRLARQEAERKHQREQPELVERRLPALPVAAGELR